MKRRKKKRKKKEKEPEPEHEEEENSEVLKLSQIGDSMDLDESELLNDDNGYDSKYDNDEGNEEEENDDDENDDENHDAILKKVIKPIEQYYNHMVKNIKELVNIVNDGSKVNYDEEDGCDTHIIDTVNNRKKKNK